MKYPKLPKKFKEKWLKALRSGEYDQGEASLYLDGAYCCLGVAGHICGISNKSMTDKSYFQKNDFTTQTLKSYGNKLPKILITVSPFIEVGGVIWKLANMNDGAKSFKQIATWIEKNL